MNTTIGERLKSKRKENGLTLTDVKDKTGISTGNLSDIERGKYLPSATMLIALSELYNCSTDWILTGKLLISDTKEDLLISEILHMISTFSSDELSDLKDNINFIIYKRSNQKGKSSPINAHGDDARFA